MPFYHVHLGSGAPLRAGAFAFLAGATALGIACSGDTVIQAPATYSVQLTVPSSSLTIGQDSSTTVDAVVIANNDTVPNATTTLESLNPEFVSITPDGATGIRATPPGQPALVVVSYQDVNNNTVLSDTVSVTVTPNPLASIAMSIPADTTGGANTLTPGQTRTVDAVVLDATGDTVYCNLCAQSIVTAEGDTIARVQRKVRFSTPDSTVGTVTDVGDVTADSAAAAGSTIRVVLTVPGDSGVVPKFADTLAVSVVAAPPAPPGPPAPRVVGPRGSRVASAVSPEALRAGRRIALLDSRIDVRTPLRNGSLTM